MQAARAEFAARGFAGARTAQIAEQAGVNKQLIFYYFGSKRGLYDAVLRTAGGTLLRSAQSTDSDRPTGTPAERLREGVSGLYRSLTDTPDLAGILFRGIRDPGIASASLEAFVRQLVDEFQSIISEGQGLGYFRDDADPELAARQAAVLALGYLALEEQIGKGPAPEHRAEWVDRACDLLIRSLSW